jgi:enoyl-CoA hydratase/carnithine racemase
MPLETIAPLLDGAAVATLGDALDRYGELVATPGRCPCPVMALVDGPALGGGLGLAAAADVVLATPRAVFGLPEALLGLIPVFAFASVAARTGAVRARLLAMGGPTLSAEEALRIGLVDEVVDDLEVAAARYAARFGRMDHRSIAAVKRLVAGADPCGGGYLPDARLEAIKLGASVETRARMSRLVAGEAPWAGDATS